jgi:hypothetical protein
MKQTADYTPTVNTQVNIIKNKLPDVFTKKGRFEKAEVTTQDAEYKPTVIESRPKPRIIRAGPLQVSRDIHVK